MSQEILQFQIFTFQDHTQIVHILSKVCDVVSFQLDFQNNLIQYRINRQEWMRLNDLICFMKEGFIKFKIGNLINLFESLLLHVFWLEENGIQHNFLDLNRIWIKWRLYQDFHSDSAQCKYDFKIFFTGFQCPLYEMGILGFEEESASNKIKKIINQIILDLLCFNYKFSKKNTKQNDSIYKLLTNFQNILVKQDLHLNLVLLELNELKSKQKIKTTDKIALKQWQKVNFLSTEFLEEGSYKIIKIDAREKFYSFSYHINFQDQQKNSNCYSFDKQQLNQNLLFPSLILLKNNVKNQIGKHAQQQLNQKIGKLEQLFRFDNFNIMEMQQDIEEAVNNHKIFKYFQNSVWYLLENLKQISESIFLEDLPSLIEDRLNLELQLKILKLIKELI